MVGFIFFANVWTDVLWYRQLGYFEVFLTENLARITIFLTGFAAMFAAMFFAIRIATRPVRSTPPTRTSGTTSTATRPSLSRSAVWS